MCQQKSPPSKMSRKQKIVTRSNSNSNVSMKQSSAAAARRTRTKRRKPKYLSLNSKLSPKLKKKKRNNKHSKTMQQKEPKKQKQQLINLFPLHPEERSSSKLISMHEQDQDTNVGVASFLFDTATDSTATLDGLLTASSEGPPSPPQSPPLVTYGYRYGLVRAAMRSRERDASEERWVSYSEVVLDDNSVKKKIKEEEEEAGSSCVDDDDAGARRMKKVQGEKRKRRLLDLKLDYEEILNAWSDKSPLFVVDDHGESPQTVPDLHNPDMLIDGWGNTDNLWTVPEMTDNSTSVKADDELQCKEGWNREHRLASLLRYKEKRKNRLFSKSIRYEVRKLNAEKRPRLKHQKLTCLPNNWNAIRGIGSICEKKFRSVDFCTLYSPCSIGRVQWEIGPPFEWLSFSAPSSILLHLVCYMARAYIVIMKASIPYLFLLK